MAGYDYLLLPQIREIYFPWNWSWKHKEVSEVAIKYQEEIGSWQGIFINTIDSETAKQLQFYIL